VVVLKPLTPEQILELMGRALADAERGLGGLQPEVAQEALDFLAAAADGDARTGLNVLELAVTTTPADAEGRRVVDVAGMRDAFARKALLYDRAGEEHFNIISALHKAVRNSDADAGLYWLARMLEAGEDPLYVARRLVRFASEDVGLADPQALVQAMAAQQAVHFVGLPEGALALAQAVVYLAAAPKSNALYRAYGEASKDALETRAEPVPLHIRNAPTGLMKGLGYGQGYRYAHDEEGGVAAMTSLPDNLLDRRYFHPTDRGAEPALGERLEAARRRREAAGAEAMVESGTSSEPER
jgi:putative ATPase